MQQFLLLLKPELKHNNEPRRRVARNQSWKSSSVSADFYIRNEVKNQGKSLKECGDATIPRLGAAVTETCFRPLAPVPTLAASFSRLLSNRREIGSSI